MLGTYVYGFRSHPEIIGRAWGGVPDSLLPVYTFNMMLAALGYFVFTPFLMTRVFGRNDRIAGKFGPGLLSLLYAGVLVFSALWMPLTLEMIRNFYALPDSRVTVYDEVILKNGEFVSSFSRLDQIEERARLERQEDRIRVQYRNADGSKEKIIGFEPDLISGPVFTRFVHAHWDRLKTGEQVTFHLPAPNLLRLVRFKMSRDDRSRYAREDALVLKMEPAGFFVRFFVDASYFVFDLDSRRLEEIHGLTILPVKRNGKWQNAHVNMYFRYPEQPTAGSGTNTVLLSPGSVPETG